LLTESSSDKEPEYRLIDGLTTLKERNLPLQGKNIGEPIN